MVFDVKLPILGFESIEQFHFEHVDDLFAKIVSIKEEKPTFTLVNPYLLRDYQFDIPLAAKAALQINEETHILVYNILVLCEPIENSMINFIAPLVFNINNKMMGQIILDGYRYPHYGLNERISTFFSGE